MKSKSISESKKIYTAAAKSANIPKKFWMGTLWRRMIPETIISMTPVRNDKLAKATTNQQMEWRNYLLGKPKILKGSGTIVILGDYLADTAEVFAYGIAGFAIRKGLSVKTFHIGEINSKKAPPKEVDGSVSKYDVMLINRIHTDDGPERRSIVRDFATYYYKNSIVILVIYGNDPLDYLYKYVGVDPIAVFYFPFKGRQLGEKIKEMAVEH